MPMLNDFQKLQKDIAAAPIVDAKTLKAIGEYNDGMDRLNASLVKLAAGFISVYNSYSKWASKVAEDAATGLFNFLDRFAPGAASSAVTGAMTRTPMGAALVAMGADGSTTPTGTTAAASGGADRTKALIAAIKGSGSTEKEKAADTKGTTSSTGAISGNVIGVGANPIVTALQEQQGIALQQLSCLQVLAAKYGYAATYMDVTASGATPSTPANSSTNRSPLVTKSK
jgi:hypothetical protein